MLAADVSAGEPWEPSASRLGWGLIRHCAGESPPADVPANPNHAVLSARAVLSGQALCTSQNPVFEGGIFPVGFCVWLPSPCSTLAGSGEQNSHPSYDCLEFLCWGSWQRLWVHKMTSAVSQRNCRGSQSQLISGVHFQASSVTWAARGLPELPRGAVSHDSWLVCDAFWDGCWQHQSCQLGAQCCVHLPWEICALADWTLGDLEPLDVHSLGEALRGYLQDLPSPVVPVSVHGDILRILQGKGLPWLPWEWAAGRDGHIWGIKIIPLPLGPGTWPPPLPALLCCDAAGAWRVVPAVPALPSCLVLSPEIPQPENCRKQLQLALESPAVPLQNMLTLQFLLRHLGKVSQQAESNSLHPRALGEIFGPLLLRLPGARYVRLLVPAVFPAPATVPARTRSPAWNSRAACIPCWAARGVKLLAALRGGTQSQDRAPAALSAWGLAAGMDQLTPGDLGAVLPQSCCS